MKHLVKLLFAALLIIGANAFAGDKDPLFINLTTDNPHSAKMAIGFASKQFAKGHPLTIFLNDTGVTLADTSLARFSEHQKMLNELIAKGANIIICPMCMQYFGVKDAEIIKGVKVGNPDTVGDALFKDNTKTLTW